MTCGYSTRVRVRPIIPGRNRLGNRKGRVQDQEGAGSGTGKGGFSEPQAGNANVSRLVGGESTCADGSLRALLGHLQVGLLHRLPDVHVLPVWQAHTHTHTFTLLAALILESHHFLSGPLFSLPLFSLPDRDSCDLPAVTVVTSGGAV